MFYKQYKFKKNHIPTQEDINILNNFNNLCKYPPNIFIDSEEELDEHYDKMFECQKELRGKIEIIPEE